MRVRASGAGPLGAGPLGVGLLLAPATPAGRGDPARRFDGDRGRDRLPRDDDGLEHPLTRCIRPSRSIGSELP